MRRSGGWPTVLRDVVTIVVIAVVVSALVKTFVVRSFYIPSASMEQTLRIDDRILVDELTPRWSGYDRGDVVVFADPGGWLPPATRSRQSPLEAGADALLGLVGFPDRDSDTHLVKRVVGLPGDHVVCCNPLGQVSVNDVPIDELGYVHLPPGDTAASRVPFDVIVPSGSLWVLGDNRSASADSRSHTDQPGGGFVPIGNVVGRAFLRTWPISQIGAIASQRAAFSGVPEAEPAPSP